MKHIEVLQMCVAIQMQGPLTVLDNAEIKPIAVEIWVFNHINYCYNT